MNQKHREQRQEEVDAQKARVAKRLRDPDMQERLKDPHFRKKMEEIGFPVNGEHGPLS